MVPDGPNMGWGNFGPTLSQIGLELRGLASSRVREKYVLKDLFILDTYMRECMYMFVCFAYMCIEPEVIHSLSDYHWSGGLKDRAEGGPKGRPVCGAAHRWTDKARINTNRYPHTMGLRNQVLAGFVAAKRGPSFRR